MQFGIKGDPSIEPPLEPTTIPDDPVTQNNAKGTITFANAGRAPAPRRSSSTCRTTSRSTRKASPPFGKVVSGMDVVESLYNSYGDMAPRGSGPDPKLIETQGNSYLESRFPRLDLIKKAAVNPAT